MTSNQSKTYSRDEFTSELTSFYEFLVRLHLPSSAIRYPPPAGWLDITPENLSFLEKNDTVLDLIKHMPFISRDDSQHAYQIYEKTFAVDYIGDEFKNSYGIPNASPDIADPMLETTEVPAHVMTIAQTSGGRDGFYFLCDTERWTVTICDFQFGPKDTTNLTQRSWMDDPEYEEESWRDYAAYTPKDFLEMLKEQYRKLEVIPVEATLVLTGDTVPTGVDLDSLKNIFWEHGWPEGDYRKEECMKKAKEVREEIWR